MLEKILSDAVLLQTKSNESARNVTIPFETIESKTEVIDIISSFYVSKMEKSFDLKFSTLYHNL